MDIENELKRIGFNLFKNLDKSKHDGLVRMAWNGIYKNELIAVLIIKKEGNWILDRILFSSYEKEIEKKYFKSNIQIETVISFINEIK